MPSITTSSHSGLGAIIYQSEFVRRNGQLSLTKHDSDKSSGKCLSLACYRFMDCISAIDEDSTLSSPQKLFLGCKPTGWPYQDWIWVKINEPSADDTKMQFLVYPFSV